MLLSAKEIATRYAGRTVKCRVVKSPPVINVTRKNLDYFNAKIIGWKESNLKEPSYVCVEILPPGMTQILLKNFNLGYHFTADRNNNGFGKKLLPEEIILPADAGVASKPEWPGKCRDCGSPAVIMSVRIDCSNDSCKNKFKTHSALDLFLPKELRPPGWDKDPNRKRRAGVDREDFIVCSICNERANNGSFVKDRVGTFKATCPKNHSWIFELHIGDKLAGKNVSIYKGKNIFIPYKM